MLKPFLQVVAISVSMTCAYADSKTGNFFSLAQETYLANHPSVLAYFSKIYEGYTPQQIAQKYKLSKETTEKYLTALAKIKVLKMPANKGGPIELLVQGVHSHRANGPITQKFTDLMIRQTFEETLIRWNNVDQRGDLHLSSMGYWLTEEEYRDLQKELGEIEKKYLEASIENRKAKTKDAFRISSFLTLLPNWQQSVFEEVKKDFK